MYIDLKSHATGGEHIIWVALWNDYPTDVLWNWVSTLNLGGAPLSPICINIGGALIYIRLWGQLADLLADLHQYQWSPDILRPWAQHAILHKYRSRSDIYTDRSMLTRILILLTAST